MTTASDGRFERLRALVLETPDDELEGKVSADPGIDEALDTVFDKMADLFNPEKAKSGKATFQYDVETSDGTKHYYLHIENGTCVASRGTKDADLTSTIKLVDMLHLGTGKITGQEAFAGGKFTLAGNPFAGLKMAEWFDPL